MYAKFILCIPEFLPYQGKGAEMFNIAKNAYNTISYNFKNVN